jgi:phenylalanyl-tRNA synthetase beta chain
MYTKEQLPDDEKIRDSITFNAFEVEEVEKKGSDTVFDIKVLPNRAHDALAHRGMARDICALLDIPFVDPHTYYRGEGDVTVRAPIIQSVDMSACTRFLGVRIDGVVVTDSPLWLKEKLEAIGQKSINSIVDATNYVQFSINKPMHAYDAALIKDGTLIARYAKEGETLTTLDNKELALDPTTLVIADTEKPLGLAGIKGGKFSGVSDTTTSVILESANFNGTLIRKTSEKYNIKTDASKRFENEISDELAEEGMRMTIALILELNPKAKVSSIVDVSNPLPAPRSIVCRTDKINTLLGTTCTDDEVEKIYKRLLFAYTKKEKGVYEVTIPHDRLDLTKEVDLIEEVARVRGLSSIKGVLPSLSRKGLPHKRLYYEMKIKNILFNAGFSEMYTYTFGIEGEVEIKKALSDKKKLRTSLGRGVKDALIMNIHNMPLLGVDVVKVFEFGNVFTKSAERRNFALGIDDGKKKTTFTEEVDLILSQIKRELGVKELTYITVETKPYVIELDFDTLIETLPEPTSYESLAKDLATRAESAIYNHVSPYPFIVRDIAVWTKEGTMWDDIYTLAKTIDDERIVRIACFDTFTKDIGGERKTSFAFRFVIQSFEKTLTDEDANKIAERMYSLLKEKGHEIR